MPPAVAVGGSSVFYIGASTPDGGGEGFFVVGSIAKP
jgi:hypothetical protein